MEIKASQVKALRELTGVGMMQCKSALIEANGDMQLAVEKLRIAGLAQADKKSGRVAAEGIIAVMTSDDRCAAAMVEINCETDFVARGDDFNAFAAQIAQCVLRVNPDDIEKLSASALQHDQPNTVEQVRRDLVQRLGENIQISRFECLRAESGVCGAYSHGGRIGVLVQLEHCADQALAKDIAMHIAASKPRYINREAMPSEDYAKERAILSEKAKQSGKPADMMEKIVDGQMNKFFAECVLLEQAFVKNTDQRVGDLVSAAKAEVGNFCYFVVGDNIETQAE